MGSKPILKIIKIGGNIIDDTDALQTTLKYFSELEEHKILIHGGGKLATQLCSQMNIPTKMIDGRRITNQNSLDVATMVYAGKINKNIVAYLQMLNCNAIGLSGADANIIQSEKRRVKTIDYGFVGDIKFVNASILNTLLNSDLTPIFCAITHNKKGQLLNTNADGIASEIAIAMSAYFQSELYYCFEKKGVLKSIEDENSMITQIDETKYENLKKDKIIYEGMIPKIDNCFRALKNKVSKVYIGDNTMLKKNAILFTTLSL